MTKQEEQFVHFVTCIESLNSAWRIITAIKEQHSGNPLIAPAFRFALIEYSKPYRQSFGTQRWCLDESCIPTGMRDIHKRITDSRDRIHAHSDLNILDAKLYVKESGSRRWAGIVKNKITGSEELPNIDEFQTLIEQTLDNMYEKEKELEASLP